MLLSDAVNRARLQALQVKPGFTLAAEVNVDGKMKGRDKVFQGGWDLFCCAEKEEKKRHHFSHGFLRPIPPRARSLIYPAWCPCVSNADGGLCSDAMCPIHVCRALHEGPGAVFLAF